MVLASVISSHDHSRKISLISSCRNYPSQIFSLFDITKKVCFSFETKMKKNVITLEILTNISLNTDWQTCAWFLQKGYNENALEERGEKPIAQVLAGGSSVEVKSAPEMHF